MTSSNLQPTIEPSRFSCSGQAFVGKLSVLPENNCAEALELISTVHYSNFQTFSTGIIFRSTFNVHPEDLLEKIATTSKTSCVNSGF